MDTHKNQNGKGHTEHGKGHGKGHHKDGCICFTNDTLILTDSGFRPIEELDVGDMIQTKDNGCQPIVWLGQQSIGRGRMIYDETLCPVKLRYRGSELIVSQQHRILTILSGQEVFVPAKGLDVQMLQPTNGITYYHILFEHHEVINANMIWSESFYPGDEALRTISQEQVTEIRKLFPDNQFSLARPHVGPKAYQRSI